MSTTPDSDLNLDLHFLPEWARKSPQENRYSQFEGDSGDSRPRRGPRGDRPPRDRGPRGPGSGPGGPRRDGGGRGEPRGDRGGPRGPRPERRGGPQGGERRGDRGPDRGRPGRFGQREERAPLPPLPQVDVTLIPEQAGVESIARQIKLGGRAYPLFDIAALVAQKPERFHVEFRVVKKGDAPAQRLFACTLDDTLWLDADEAARHALNRHFDKFYQAERTPTDAPKGSFSQVAVCGMSGVTLGPSNWHGYQAALTRLHAERFARVPFDVFKSRVKTVKDEEQVKKWVEEQSFKTEYVCLNVPEPMRLASRDALESHFMATHRSAVVKEVQSLSIPGVAALNLRCQPLRELARRQVEDQRRFPLKLVNVLSQQFSSLGLQFFKKDKTVTHVAVARPSFLDLESTPVSEGVARIMHFIDATPGCTRLKLMEALAPGLAAAHAAPAAAPEGGAAPAPVTPSPAEAAVVADLHWLIHQGHVLEFATGIMETAKRPNPKPQQQPKRKASQDYLPVFMQVTPLLGGG